MLLQSLAFDEASCTALEESRDAHTLEVRQAREAVDRLSHDVAGVWVWVFECVCFLSVCFGVWVWVCECACTSVFVHACVCFLSVCVCACVCVFVCVWTLCI